MAGLRKVVLKILIPSLILIIIVMWACLPFYWGSCESTLGRWAAGTFSGEVMRKMALGKEKEEKLTISMEI